MWICLEECYLRKNNSINFRNVQNFVQTTFNTKFQHGQFIAKQDNIYVLQFEVFYSLPIVFLDKKYYQLLFDFQQILADRNYYRYGWESLCNKKIEKLLRYTKKYLTYSEYNFYSYWLRQNITKRHEHVWVCETVPKYY